MCDLQWRRREWRMRLWQAEDRKGKTQGQPPRLSKRAPLATGFCFVLVLKSVGASSHKR
jgi:hypothetical protein